MIDPVMGHFHDSNQVKVSFRVSLLSILRSPAESGRRTGAFQASDSAKASTGQDGGQAGVRFQDGCSDNEE